MKRAPNQAATKDQGNIKNVNFVGKAPVDEFCPNASNLQVSVKFGQVWSKTLNQSNVNHNNNKFYIIQLLESKSTPKEYFTFFRWGRVGKPGQNKFMRYQDRMHEAIAEFEDKLHSKTVDGGYIELSIVYDDDKEAKGVSLDQQMNNAISTSKLDKRVADLVRLLFDIKLMKQTMKSIGFDVDKMPLGKLSQNDLDNGYKILNQLTTELENKRPKSSVISDLNNQFYTQIPHDVGFKNMQAMVIKTKEAIKEKLDLLDTLANMKITNNLMGSSAQDAGDSTNVLDTHYDSLKNKICPVDKDSRTWSIVSDFIDKGACPTHSWYKLELLDLFEIEREGEAGNYDDSAGNRMMLWHGSRLTNFVGILSQGLRIAPPEAPCTGYMFGKGVYFADMVTKSANYCHHNLSDDIGMLLICEVALGQTNDLLHAKHDANKLPAGKHSTKGLGSMAPIEKNFKQLDGASVPMGPAVKNSVRGSLMFNEYIVYDTNQIKMKYLVKVKFNSPN